MMRQTIDEYLDGALDAQARAAVEQTLARDPAAAELAAALRAQRAVRAAAFESYQPSQAEASALATQILAACDEEAAAPVGRITPASGHWLRYGAGIAAAVAIALTAFGLGRMTAAPAPSPTLISGTGAAQDKTPLVYVVTVPAQRGEEVSTKLFRMASAEDAEVKVRELQALSEPQVAEVGEIALPGRI